MVVGILYIREIPTTCCGYRYVSGYQNEKDTSTHRIAFIPSGKGARLTKCKGATKSNLAK